MDAFLGWVTGVMSDLLFWVVGVRGADVLEGGGQTRPQVMGFGLVLLRFLMICGGRDMFPHYLDEKYFSSDFYPWSLTRLAGLLLGLVGLSSCVGCFHHICSALVIIFVLCEWGVGGLVPLWGFVWDMMRILGFWVLGLSERCGIVCFCLGLL
jgi:hypothetical protein